MNANVAKEIILTQPGLEQGASVTKPISKPFGITAGGAARLRVDVYVGKVVGTVDVGLEHSSGFNIWSTTKTVSVTASTDTSVTIAPATDILNATGHGLSENQAVVLNATSLPGGVIPNEVFYVEFIDSNNFYLRRASGTRVDFTSAGTGVTFTPVRLFSFAFNPETATDISNGYIPLRSSGRVYAVTDAAESIQVVGVRILQEE